MLNKQTPSATNYAAQSMKWHFTMACGMFYPNFPAKKKLYHTFIFMYPHTVLHFQSFLLGYTASQWSQLQQKKHSSALFLHCSSQKSGKTHSRKGLCLNSL